MPKIDFPVAVSDGQEFTASTGVVYTYVGTPPNGYWSAEVNTGGGDSNNTDVSETPPANPSEGDLWWDSSNDSGKLYIYYVDADSSQWVETSPNSGGDSSVGDLQAVTDAGNTTTKGATFGGQVTASGGIEFGDGTVQTTAATTAAAQDLQSVTDEGNTTTNGATFGENIVIDEPSGADSFRVTLGGNQVYRVSSVGTVQIGDGNEIQLNVDGSGQFAGSVSVGGTADANTISEYEEGTWTPGMNPAWFSNTQTPIGKYTKIGNVVTVAGRLVVECIDYSATNASTTVNLPFPVDADNGGGFTLTILQGGTNFGVLAGPERLYSSVKATGFATPYADITCGLVSSTYYPNSQAVTILINITYTTNL
tara:strand:- start:1623 stop:2720 length:1098 start_codon:yes stop_codon:yes gene_type:complete